MFPLIIVTICVLGATFIISLMMAILEQGDERVAGAINALILALGITTLSLVLASRFY